jgi:hypothetical protein
MRPVLHARGQHQAAIALIKNVRSRLPSVKSVELRGEGQVSFVLIKDAGQGEVEIELPNRYRISLRVASAMRAVPGRG